MSTFTKTTNEPTASNNKSDRTQVKICDTWKTLKYLNINENRKDVDRYKFVVLFLLIVVLFDFLNIKSVKLYAIPFIFSTTLLLYNNTPSKTIVNSASNITYRPLIEADDTGR